MLDPQMCRLRQRRLADLIAALHLDAAVIGRTPHVYYFSGHLPFWLHSAGYVQFADGWSWLVTANAPVQGMAADEVDSYDAQWFSTQRQEQPSLVAERVIAKLKQRNVSRIGFDASAVNSQVVHRFDGECVSLDADLFQMRRRKDPDELKLMRRAIDCCQAMYRRMREIIEPGIPEIRVFAELHSIAVQIVGETLSARLGNDYASGERGAPPRPGHVAQAGQMYILDLGPAYRGYFSDNCRSFAVNRRPTDSQLRAANIISGAFPLLEGMIRPGVRCCDICKAVDEYLVAHGANALPHHLGHGVGLEPHEFPHLNPKWDDTLAEGEIIACEPGIYAPELNCGLRFENQYLVTQNGVENLTPFPMDIA